ncbi:DapH/DapD/GlmU-related protein [Croceicoccus sp. Ery15]|uniref:acyltransferase n=1 Tax=Croceicoccus sp. Ery15 TaxID=1703338 RepID=UPI001E3A0BE6|nr:acyltransferase [Croceicoccus sp. Ery15]
MTTTGLARFIDRGFVALAVNLLTIFRIKWRHRFLLRAYRRWGMRMKEWPNYISARSDVDGGNYSLIYVGEGVTISSYVRLLTHDWSPHTIGKAMGIFTEKPLGKFGQISIGDFSFVGTGSVIMPGANIGKGCLIGAGTVVRGTIPDFSVVIGSPGQIIGDSRDVFWRMAAREGWELPSEAVRSVL